MVDNAVFINVSLNEAFLVYKNNVDNKESLNYNSFLCSVIRMLVIIYGDEIVKSFLEKNVSLFDSILMKYGYDLNNLNEFKFLLEKYYNFSKKIGNKTIKKKNKYINLVQKCLIDMMLKRKSTEVVDNNLLSEFYNLLFTANSKDFYRKSFAVLSAYNPYEIDEYAKKMGIFGG